MTKGTGQEIGEVKIRKGKRRVRRRGRRQRIGHG